MEKWSCEKYERYLQQMQTGELEMSIEQVMDEMHAQFHALYEDFIVEDTNDRAVTDEEFQKANQVYFALGHALIIQIMHKLDVPQAEGATSKEHLVENKSEKDEQKKEVEGMNWSDDGSEYHPPPNQVSAAAGAEVAKEIPYNVLSGILSPILELPMCNVMSELILQEIMVKCELVQERFQRREDFGLREEKFIVALVESKLDAQSRLMWNWDLADNAKEPNMELMITFIKKRQKRITPAERRAAKDLERKFIEDVHLTDLSCVYCRGKHKMCRCEKFRALEFSERWNVVERLRVCVNCFSKAHLTVNCREGACWKCHTPHNSLMCKHSPANKQT